MQKMIVITGAAGFIGSFLAQYFNEQGQDNLILVDDFTKSEKEINHKDLDYAFKIQRDKFQEWLQQNNIPISGIIHLGARTDTTETNYELLKELNFDYSQWLWNYCVHHQIPFIYASSAATYGDGEYGYEDDEKLCYKLKPLNPYGVSKNEFDIWAIQQKNHPPFWAGLKFFNVYGPHESHKGRMASVVYHAFHQIQKEGKVKLFKSHHPDYENGGQMRDFIYVKDVIQIIDWLLKTQNQSGIFNVGTGKARSFKSLALAVFESINQKEKIEFIDTPLNIRDKYQYFTEAKMDKLKKAGYSEKLYTLEEGVKDYVLNYLLLESSKES